MARTTGYTGRIVFDSSRPDGTPRKLLDVSRITGMGWRPRIDLEEGLAQTYRWYCANRAGTSVVTQHGPSNEAVPQEAAAQGSAA